MDWPSCHRLLLYTCPKLTDSEIPKKSCITNAVMEKLTKLDKIDKNLIAVRASLHFFFSTNLKTEYFILYFNCHRWVVHEWPLLVLLVQHSVHPFTPWHSSCVESQEPSHRVQVLHWPAHWENNGRGDGCCDQEIRHRKKGLSIFGHVLSLWLMSF